MEANVHIITGLVSAAQNIYKCVQRAGLEVSDMVLEPLASVYAVLDEEEKEVGIALLDVGGGTTDLAVFEERTIRHTAVIGDCGQEGHRRHPEGPRHPERAGGETQDGARVRLRPRRWWTTNRSCSRASAAGRRSRSTSGCWRRSSSRGWRRSSKSRPSRSSAPVTRNTSRRAWS